MWFVVGVLVLLGLAPACVASPFQHIDSSTLAIMKNDMESISYMADTVYKSGLLRMGQPDDEDDQDPAVQKQLSNTVEEISQKLVQENMPSSSELNSPNLLAQPEVAVSGPPNQNPSDPTSGGGAITRELVAATKDTGDNMYNGHDPGDGVERDNTPLGVGGGVIGSGMLIHQEARATKTLPPHVHSPQSTNATAVEDQYLVQLSQEMNEEEEAEPDTGFTGHVTLVKGDHLYVHGGWDGKSHNKELWEFGFVSKKWRKLAQGDEAWMKPKPRTNHTGVVWNGNLWIFGGKAPKAENDVWVYDLVQHRWTQFNTSWGAEPIERTHAVAVVDPVGRVIVQGGMGAFQTGYAADMWIWEPGPQSSSIWTEMMFEDGPTKRVSPRIGHAITWMGGIYFFGGEYQGVYLNDLWFWDAEFNRWNEIPVFDEETGYPPARAFHAIMFRSLLLVFGGRGTKLDSDDKPEPTVFGDLWGYDVNLQTWTEIKATGSKPPPLYNHKSVMYKNEVCLFGGQTDDEEAVKSLFCYDVAINKWRSVYG